VGLQAYFAWARPTPLQVHIRTNDDNGARPADEKHSVVSCRDFLRTPRRLD